MRKIWNAIKIMSPIIPFALARKAYAQGPDQEDTEEDLTPEIETHINKIFLTPDISEFTDLKIFAFDAEILGKEVATHLDTTLGRHITTRFNDG